jgi:SAM-dependent methyltransferase
VPVVLQTVRTMFGRAAPDMLPMAAAPVRPPPGPETPPAEPTHWPAGRLAVAEALWGEGYLFPGGEDETLRLAKPLGLSAEASVLMIGAGSGGPPRTIAAHLGSWVTGFESDPALVSLAAARCARSGLGRRVSVASWDPEAPDFRARQYHHGLALEPLRVAHPEAALAAIAGALKPSGQFLLVETVTEQPLDLDDPVVGAWMRLEARSHPPPTEMAVTRMLGRLGFDVRVTEDISARHAAQALHGWRCAVAALQDDPPDARRAAPLVAEAELWLLRLRLIRDGKLRLMRWIALGHGGM